MKKLSIYLILLFVLPAFIFTGCKDKEVVEPTFDTLTKYLVANNMDLPEIIMYHGTNGDVKFVTGPPKTDADIPAFVGNKYIIDIRSVEAFGDGHITGAHNVTLGNILTEAVKAGNKRILVVCYTGQTACYATSLLRLYGYPDAQALKWGMCGWNPDFAEKWDAQIGSEPAKGDENWSNSSAPANIKYESPILNDNSTDGAAILRSRVEVVLAAGFKTAKNADVLGTPTNYFINNYFSDGDYTAFGHIDDAQRILPLSIADDLVYFVNPSKQVVTYCYTGQTSAVIAAYLNVLGYNSSSLLYGMNGLYNTNTAWKSNQWGGDSNPKHLSTDK